MEKREQHGQGLYSEASEEGSAEAMDGTAGVHVCGGKRSTLRLLLLFAFFLCPLFVLTRPEPVSIRRAFMPTFFSEMICVFLILKGYIMSVDVQVPFSRSNR